MRVIDHKRFKKTAEKSKPNQSRKKVSTLAVILIVLVPLIAIGAYGYLNIYVVEKEIENLALQPANNESLGYAIPEDDPFDTTVYPLKVLKGEDFMSLYNAMSYPNTQVIASPPLITGDDAVDERIRALAEARGYARTSTPEQAIVRVDNEPRLDTDDLLQPLAATDWSRLKAAASEDGITISLLSAYRSPAYQREIFLNRLYNSISLYDLQNGAGDDAINNVLELTAVPGYSRHHTGYTIDLWCEDGSTAFVQSECYQWIKANNYEMAMEYGWIPSYPEEVKLQGPEPEPWEYVWVGEVVRDKKS